MKNLDLMLSKAIEIAAKAHSGVFDKGGKPYILHPLWVMNKVRFAGTKAMIVAVLHDVVEDTLYQINDLIDLGIDDDEVITALKLLDFRNVDYDQRIKEIANNDLAKLVKLRDIEHNSKVTRLKGLRKKDFDRLEKYLRSYTYLS